MVGYRAHFLSYGLGCFRIYKMLKGTLLALIKSAEGAMAAFASRRPYLLKGKLHLISK